MICRTPNKQVSHYTLIGGEGNLLRAATSSSNIASGKRKRASKTRRILRENGLSIVLFSCFLAFLIGQAITGHRQYNEDLKEHEQRSITFTEYIRSDHFLEATAENWESEFLQMFAYVLFTVFLYQKGSSESKKLAEQDPVDKEPQRSTNGVPWPVRKGGVVSKLYENSLTLAFLTLFLISFSVHAIAGVGLYNKEQAQHGTQPISV
jgi:hypothetical protein